MKIKKTIREFETETGLFSTKEIGNVGKRRKTKIQKKRTKMGEGGEFFPAPQIGERFRSFRLGAGPEEAPPITK
jgi:hypothetical protein